MQRHDDVLRRCLRDKLAKICRSSCRLMFIHPRKLETANYRLPRALRLNKKSRSTAPVIFLTAVFSVMHVCTNAYLICIKWMFYIIIHVYNYVKLLLHTLYACVTFIPRERSMALFWTGIKRHICFPDYQTETVLYVTFICINGTWN